MNGCLRAVLVFLLLSRVGWASIWPGSAQAVRRDLASSSVQERRLAAAALGALPAPVIARLLPLVLGDSDAHVRVTAAAIAAKNDPDKYSRLVVSWLADRDPDVRLAAARFIRNVRPSASLVHALGRVLADPEADIRVAAAEALGLSEQPEATLALLGHLDDRERRVQAAVIRALIKLGDVRAVVPIAAKSQDTRAFVRKLVAGALGALADKRGGPTLLLLLRDSEPRVRASAVWALGEVRPPEASRVLIAALDDPERKVRHAAIRALAQFKDDASLGALLAIFGSTSSDGAETVAIRALTAALPGARTVLLDTLRQTTRPSIAKGCARVLAATSRPSGVLTVLIGALRRGVLEPVIAMEALAELGDRGALRVVLDRLADRRAGVRHAAATAAEAFLDPDDPEGRAVEPLLDALVVSAARPEERLMLVRVLGRTGSVRAVPGLLEYVNASSVRLRVTAIRALGHALGNVLPGGHGAGPASADAERALVLALKDDSAAVRTEAAFALRRGASAQIAEALLMALSSASTGQRMHLLHALVGAVRGLKEPALVRRLQEAFRSSSPKEQDLFIEVLGRLPDSIAPAVLGGVLRRHASDAARAKVAEVLGGSREGAPLLRRLLRDPTPRVVAAAAWAIGGVGSQGDLATLEKLTRHSDAMIASNATASWARLAHRLARADVRVLCRALRSPIAYVRSNAVSGLRHANAACPSTGFAELLQKDSSPAVRAQAALALRATPTSAEGKKALRACLLTEKEGAVAALCTASRVAAQAAGNAAISVRVGAQSTAGVPVTLVLADGMRRLAFTDRQGAVYEPMAPRGALRLDPPYTDSR